jgi:predicted transcriptional regulator
MLKPMATFNVTPEQLVIFHECLGSKVCIRIFQVFLANKSLNVSAISRKVGCNNDRCIEHLKKLAKLGIVQEEFYAGRHSFALKKGDFTDLMQQAITLMNKDEKSTPNIVHRGDSQ